MEEGWITLARWPNLKHMNFEMAFCWYQFTFIVYYISIVGSRGANLLVEISDLEAGTTVTQE